VKLILENKQFERIIQQIAEVKKNRSLLATRKAGITATENAVQINPMRYSEYIREKVGIEMNDLEDNWYSEDNSDSQI
jgi:hypothetical protein